MAQATNTTVGQIVLSGDLYGDDANSPTLVPSGVTEGTYTGFKNTGTAIPSAPYYSYAMHVDSKGRITYAKEYGVSISLDDTTTSSKGIARAGTGITSTSGVWSIDNATTSSKGKLQAGSGLDTVDGTLYCSYYGAPLASGSVFGASQSGLHMNMTNGALTVDFANLIASDTVPGTVKVGSNLTIQGDGTLSINDRQDATNSSKGYIRIGARLDVTNGILSIPDGSTSFQGKLQVGDGLNVTSGVVSLNRTSYATNTVAGLVKTGWSTGISGSGVVNLSPGWAAVGYKGAVSVGAGIAVSNASISLSEPTRKAATSSQAGLVTVASANGLSVDGTGAVNFNASTLSDATSSVKGVIQADSTYFTFSSGIISTKYADGSTWGVVKCDGSTIYELNGILYGKTISETGNLTPGLVKVGAGFTVTGGVLSTNQDAIPEATDVVKGKISVDTSNGLSITSGVLAFDQRHADNTNLGIAKGDGSTVTLSGGVLAAVTTNVELSSAYTLRTANLAIAPVALNPATTTISLQEDVETVTLLATNGTAYTLPSGTLTTNKPIGSIFKLMITQNSTGGATFTPSSVLGTSINTGANTTTYIKYAVVATNKAVPVEIFTGI